MKAKKRKENIVTKQQLEVHLLGTFFFQVPFWVTPFIVPLLGRTKVGDPSLAHLTMLNMTDFAKVKKKQQNLDKRYFIVQTYIKLYNWL